MPGMGRCGPKTIDPMAENQEKKICPHCAESIPARAKVCPRCRRWLSTWSFRNPAIAIPIFFLPVVAFYFIVAHAFLSRFQIMFNPPPYYSDSPDSIRVLESNMNWANTVDGERLFVTGVVTNQSTNAWHSLEFDIRFFNTNNQMIDAANGRSYFTVGPASDSAFRVSVAPMASSNEYSSFKIQVNNARTAKGPY
jgi:hypothetical protein